MNYYERADIREEIEKVVEKLKRQPPDRAVAIAITHMETADLWLSRAKTDD